MSAAMAVTRKKRGWWVVWRLADGAFECTRCGDVYRMNLPAPLDVVISASKAYRRLHDYCRASAAPATGQISK